MKRFRLTTRAAADLEEIVRSAARVNPDAATTVARTFLELFELLGRFPSIGARRQAITAHPLRLISLYQCLIVYRPETIFIQIIAIIPLADEAERLLSDHFNDEIDETELVLDTPIPIESLTS
jgi:plasmid stabilization system protein ParE